MSCLVAENKAKISQNRALIFELEGCVNHNKAKAYLLRSKVAENAALINKNYNSAFLGNRQLANENTDALFRNRVALFQALPANNEVETNYREAKINQAKLAFLDHRSTVNAQVLSISQDIAAVNAQAIAVNRRIMETNEQIREKNSALIAENTALIGHDHGSHTPEGNAAIVSANAAKIEEIKSRVSANNAALDALEATTDTNRNAALENSQQIAQRLVAIKANHDLIAANRSRIAQVVAARG
jgi:hypothetical protein